MVQVVRVNSPAETMEVAKKLALGLVPGSILTVEGDLAAGKTTFTKGIALGLAIDEVIDSPTFSIVKEYEGKIPLYHMDVYRLNGAADIEFILEYFERNGVCVIEWASKIVQELPTKRIDIKIERLIGNERKIIIVNKGGQLNVDFSN